MHAWCAKLGKSLQSTPVQTRNDVVADGLWFFFRDSRNVAHRCNTCRYNTQQSTDRLASHRSNTCLLRKNAILFCGSKPIGRSLVPTNDLFVFFKIKSSLRPNILHTRLLFDGIANVLDYRFVLRDLLRDGAIVYVQAVNCSKYILQLEKSDKVRNREKVKL